MHSYLVTVVVFITCATIGAALCRPLRRARRPPTSSVLRRPPCDVGIGTVRTTSGPITVEVQSVSGQHFVGLLRPDAEGRPRADLKPGVVLLVTFDPADRERLSLADDIAAVRAAFDQMLVCKGLVTVGQLDLIRHGTKSSGVVTAMRATGTTREDYREVELDLMVRRLTGGQFPAHETALVPASALPELSPGCTIDAYYLHGDETAVAVCVPPG